MKAPFGRRYVVLGVVTLGLFFYATYRWPSLQAQSSTVLRIDLLWQQLTAGTLSVWEMDGITLSQGVSLSPSNIGADKNWWMVGSGDFDADGQPDIVWHHQTDGRVAVWLMDGTVQRSGSQMGPTVTDTHWKLRTVGDLNNDGHPDLIWQHDQSGHVSAWLMNGTTMMEGTLLTPSPVYDLGWRIVGTGDMNGDGKTDHCCPNWTGLSPDV